MSFFNIYFKRLFQENEERFCGKSLNQQHVQEDLD